MNKSDRRLIKSLIARIDDLQSCVESVADNVSEHYYVSEQLLDFDLVLFYNSLVVASNKLRSLL